MRLARQVEQITVLLHPCSADCLCYLSIPTSNNGADPRSSADAQGLASMAGPQRCQRYTPFSFLVLKSWKLLAAMIVTERLLDAGMQRGRRLRAVLRVDVNAADCLSARDMVGLVGMACWCLITGTLAKRMLLEAMERVLFLSS